MVQTDSDNAMIVRLHYLMLALLSYLILSFCWDRFSMTYDRTLSAEIIKKPSFKDYQPLYFPNDQKIYYRLPCNSPVQKVLIYDMEGHFIYGENCFPIAKDAIKSIDLRKNQPGPYFFVIKQKDKIIYEQLIGKNLAPVLHTSIEATNGKNK